MIGMTFAERWLIALINCSGVKEITVAAGVKLYFECGGEFALHALVLTDW
jgi:hypothetical protein